MVFARRMKDRELKAVPSAVKALSHPRRLSILQALQQGPMSYSELLRATKTQDSSLLNYHLKRLRPLVERRGTLYYLTGIGRRLESRLLGAEESQASEESMRVARQTGVRGPSSSLMFVGACSLSAFMALFGELHMERDPVHTLRTIAWMLVLLLLALLLLSDSAAPLLCRILGPLLTFQPSVPGY